jgi:transposase
MTGNRAKRMVPGALNISTGAVLLLITDLWDANTHQYFLEMIRTQWRGWHLILCEDRGSPHTTEDSLERAAELSIQVRRLPRACPELNAMDHLFRSVKGCGVANRRTLSIDDSAMIACRHIYHLNPQERLIKAGILSANFWLTS